MKVKYKRNGKRAFHSIKTTKQLVQIKETAVIEITPTPALIQKKKNEPVWVLPAFILMMIVLFTVTFGTAFSPNLMQAEHPAFVTSLGKATANVVTIPSGRFVPYQNAWGYPTVRSVIISDYSYDLKDGRCVTYNYLFMETSRKECFAVIKNRHDEEANDLQLEQ
ncbi:MAG: hypothetical protein NT098_05385 [Candidatus Parcubacteria bacterium]|nr:hypothetical protein [Candidatus Parcubacteria bacterium]